MSIAMDPLTMAPLLLPGVQLTPGQLAQLRALDTRYFREVAALRRGDAPASAADLAVLDERVARWIREMLTAEQRDVFDRHRPRGRAEASDA